jgi:hypothetical protein
VNVSNFGVDFTLGSTVDESTGDVMHAGNGSYGYWGQATLTTAGGESITVTRRFGLLGDGLGTQPTMQWVLTADPADPSWKADAAEQRTTIWLR